MKRTTITDVAKKSGYSISTVSLVLNKKKVSIPESTREKIIQAAKELNYRPNQIAISMLTKKTKILGLIIPNNINSFFAELSNIIEREAFKKDYSLIFGNSNNSAEQTLLYMEMFFDRQIDGVIFTKSSSEQEKKDDLNIIKFIEKSKMPFVAVDRPFPGHIDHSVMTNHFKGGYLATRHLLKLGHKRIGCFTGPQDLYNTTERMEGYRSALLESGYRYDENLIFQGDFNLGREKEALDFFLKKKVTAIFSFNDMMAFGLYREAFRLGIEIPRDLSIIGFDDIPVTDIVRPSLTTIRQPIEMIGKKAVDVLIDIIDGRMKTGGKNYIFEPRLIIRGSTSILRN